jgi:hypothetical protein
MTDAHKTNSIVAFGTLLATTGTLLCCVLPAVLVSVGAGAVLVGLVSAVPQLVWLSEHKALVFGIAGALLVISGILIWRARRLPCPIEPLAARSCMRLRRVNAAVYGASVACFAVGALVAFVLPILNL